MITYLLKTSEIVIKGKNRKFFENILIRNLREKLKANKFNLENLGGEFLLETDKNIEEQISKIFGINKILEVKIFDNLDSVKDFLKKEVKEKGINIRLKVKRKDKDFKLNSKEIFEYLIREIKYFTNQSLKEINEYYLIYFRKKFLLGEEKIKGYGGLPVGSSGKGLVLLSTGFDSPVASFLMMKRGLKLTFLHFHSYPQTSIQDIEKVKEVVRILNEFNLGSELILMNILNLQKFYFQNVPHKYLVIFYRRTIFRLATWLAKDRGIKVLITGENLGQVASQTIENLKIIENATDLLVLRPLIGFNKQEIISIGENIKTADVSRLPGEDCCSLFIPKHPATKANLEKILEIENKFRREIEKLEKKIYDSRELFKF